MNAEIKSNKKREPNSKWYFFFVVFKDKILYFMFEWQEIHEMIVDLQYFTWHAATTILVDFQFRSAANEHVAD